MKHVLLLHCKAKDITFVTIPKCNIPNVLLIHYCNNLYLKSCILYKWQAANYTCALYILRRLDEWCNNVAILLCGILAFTC